jgi:hypothetical protein
LLKLECSAKACGNLGICNDPAGGALWIVSQFENYIFRSPNDPAKREREASRTHPENVSLTMPLQGVLPRQRHFAAATAFKEKMHGREFAEATWQRTHFRDASTCADPAFAGTRTPLSRTSLKHFGKLRHYRFVRHLDLL